MKKFPPEFMERMQDVLKGEAPSFFDALRGEPVRGLRVNRLKTGPAAFLKSAPFDLAPTPFCPDAFELLPGGRPGGHPYHHAGLYYLQEPSAMAPVTALDPRPGERVLDLCAAPGGKSTQILSALRGEGIALLNEAVPARARTLLQNVERWGAKNALVTSLRPDELCARYEGWFDRVLVDAPCSGEGMFRKDERAAAEWSKEHSASCAARQLLILREGARAVRPGGVLVYSTCTFSPNENEGVVDAFLKACPGFALAEIPLDASPGVGGYDAPTERCRRIYPHIFRGEGHFVARLQKTGGEEGRVPPFIPKRDKGCGLFLEWYGAHFKAPLAGAPHSAGESVYIIPDGMPDLPRGTLRAGVLAGSVRNGRFSPCHHLYISSKKEDIIQTVDFEAGDPGVIRYLKGETLGGIEGEGWLAVCAGGFPLGMGKAVGGTLKNHYPKGLRML